jgi:hypothetical protein
MKITFLLISLFFAVQQTFAQNSFGPRITAMGNNGAAVHDIWSIEANPSGISKTLSPTVALNYTKSLFDTELSRQAIVFILPIKQNFLGLSINRYGIVEYNEIKATATLAKRFGEKLSIAINGNYHQLKIANYGATSTFSVDAGAMYSLNDEVTIGLYIKNPSLQKYSKSISAIIPTIVSTGISYRASNKLLLAGTFKKDLDQKLDLSVGIDYLIIELLSLRGGITAKPFKQYVGFGVNHKKLNLDFAFESDPNLGYTPQIAVGYAF